MEKMDVDDTVVDLSVGHAYSIGPETSVTEDSRHRRVLRPRTEPRRYTESPDLALNGNAFPIKSLNGNGDSDSSEGEMPPLLPIKEMTPSEVRQRERNLRKLREELRSEEMKLVLLKKLRQSQQLKENLATVSQVMQSQPLTHPGLPSGLSITPTTVKVPSKSQQPPPTHPRHSSSGNGSAPKSTSHGIVPPLMRGQPQPTRSSSIHPQINCPPSVPRLPPANLSVPQPSQRTSLPHMNRPPVAKDIPPAVTITPAPPVQPVKQPERPREDIQTPAQRQAAAKLALRKQLEKTLLQIPPPKPPPPEMHFIPNPSNTEFIYLLGLEHVVDFLTREPKSPTPPTPFQCQQCHADFTPVWKWEKQIKNRQNNATFQQHSLGKDPRVICEQCVTSNVKKALKAEHTNRLKTAFVKALQQEQEIEQRLAQVSCNSPSPSPAAPEPSPKAPTPTPSIRPVATPPAPPPPQPTPPPTRQSHTSSSHGSSSHASTSQQDKFHQSAAAMQALQQQIFRGLSGAPPAHMLPFSPLFYPYMAMAQAAGANASGGKGATPNLVDLQRATDLHRQYLLDMIPPQSGQSRHNWKT